MASIEVSDYVNEKRGGTDVFGTLRGMWSEFARRRRRQQTIAQISRLDSRLIDDIGFDPEVVGDAARAGTWDDIQPRWPDWHPKLPR